MFDKEFLKTLTVLYVEDDESIRKSFGGMLNKVFKEVIICDDGEEGLSNYKLYTQNMDVEFDIIITDIKMPNMSGLEMVREIRKIDSDIPVIMTTAHGESNYLMEAISLNVSGYALKPIDTKAILSDVEKYCQIKRNRQLIIEKEEELSDYMDIINSIATILKVNEKDTIIEANELFCELIEYSKDELLKLKAIQLVDPDYISLAYKHMIKDTRSNKTYKGKIRFISKNKNKFTLRCTNIPSKDKYTGEINGYVSVGFLVDESELEALEKAKTSMLEQKHKVLSLNKQVKDLTKQKQHTTNAMADLPAVVKEAIVKEKKKSADLLKQVHYYEEQIQILQSKLLTLIDAKKSKNQVTQQRIKELTKENEMLKDNIIALRTEITKLTPKPPKYIE